MGFNKWVARAVTAAVFAVGTVVGLSSPASASTVHCMGYSTKTLESGELSPNSAPYVPTTVTGGSVWCMLDYGDGDWKNVGASGKNWGVVGLQRNLNRCYQQHFADYSHLQSAYGFAPLQEDGQFGSLTKAALTKVQKYIHDRIVPSQPIDGVYNDSTRVNLLFWNGGTVNGESWLSCDFLA